MARRSFLGIGKLGLRLAVAFLGVALAAIVDLSVVRSINTGHDIRELAARQEQALARSVAAAAGALYAQPPAGWGDVRLTPVLDLAARYGVGVRVLDSRQHVVGQSPGFTSMRADDVEKVPIVVTGKQVGSAAVKFNPDIGLGAIVRQFDAERLQTSLAAGAAVAALALVVSLIISRQITLPLEKVLVVVRARGAGNRSLRIEDARGTGVVHELAVALNEASDMIDQRDRLRRNLVANIAHELRTPVAILQASHEAMLDGVTEPTAQNLRSLREEVLRLARMIEDLQRLAAAEAAALQLRMGPGDLSVIAADAAASLSGAFGAAGVRLERALSPVRVLCDAERMREVVVNLLTNALKFTPAGGRALVATGRDDQGEARLVVSDTGIGIPPDELPRVTERFFRGQRSAEMGAGSGIGLTIVAEFVRAHDGRLRITSEPDHGTQVTITMPAAGASGRRGLARRGSDAGGTGFDAGAGLSVGHPPPRRAIRGIGCFS